jgi:hypothetical protein
MIAPDTRVPPIPSGTLCHYHGVVVRAYATVWPGEVWYGGYKVVLPGNRRWVYAQREELEVVNDRR